MKHLIIQAELSNFINDEVKKLKSEGKIKDVETDLSQLREVEPYAYAILTTLKVIHDNA